MNLVGAGVHAVHGAGHFAAFGRSVRGDDGTAGAPASAGGAAMGQPVVNVAMTAIPVTKNLSVLVSDTNRVRRFLRGEWSQGFSGKARMS